MNFMICMFALVAVSSAALLPEDGYNYEPPKIQLGGPQTQVGAPFFPAGVAHSAASNIDLSTIERQVDKDVYNDRQVPVAHSAPSMGYSSPAGLFPEHGYEPPQTQSGDPQIEPMVLFQPAQNTDLFTIEHQVETDAKGHRVPVASK